MDNRSTTTITREKTYTFDIVETAMMLFSAFDEYTLRDFTGLPVDHPAKASEITVRNKREELGTASSRMACIQLSEICEATWLSLSEDERDCITWDWEFCPAFILHCVNWHDLQETINAKPADLAQCYRNAVAVSEAYTRAKRA